MSHLFGFMSLYGIILFRVSCLKSIIYTYSYTYLYHQFLPLHLNLPYCLFLSSQQQNHPLSSPLLSALTSLRFKITLPPLLLPIPSKPTTPPTAPTPPPPPPPLTRHAPSPYA